MSSPCLRPRRRDCCLYFSTGGNDTVGRVPLTGSNPRFYWVDTAGGGSFGLAADDAHLYWGGEGMIGRVGLDGAAATPGFIGGLATSRQSSVAVDAGYVYWVEPGNGTIGRANLDGSGVDESFIATGFPMGVAVDASHVYWADGIAGTIGRANLDGSGVEADFITGANLPGAVAVDAAHVYWTNFGADSIGRADLDGSGAVQAFVGTANDPFGLAVDGEHIYWTDLSTGGIGRANLDGSDVDAGFIDQAGAFGVAVGPPGAIGDVSRKRPPQGRPGTDPCRGVGPSAADRHRPRHDHARARNGASLSNSFRRRFCSCAPAARASCG